MSLPTCHKPKVKGDDHRKELPITGHETDAEELLASFGVDLGSGFSQEQVKSQRAKFGENRLTPPDVMPMWLLYILQYWDVFALLLLTGGTLCFIAYGIDQSDPSNLYLGCILVAVVVLSATFSFFQQSKSMKIMDGFKSLVPKKCKCIREGVTQILDASELVPGDIVEFQEGDQVPADVRILSCVNLKVDNSSLTGESEAQDRLPDLQPGGKDDKGNPRRVPAIEAQNLMFFSTIITNGYGKGIVIGTGDNTVMGQIAGLTTQTETKETLIAQDINRFISVIAVIAITIGITFMSIGIGLGVYTVISAIVFAIGVIVATVPEGLLVTLTVSLALTAKRMHSKNVLVKNVPSVETLGSTSLIASDKTGTLTQNRMTVQHCWYDDQIHSCPAYKNLVEYAQGHAAPSTDKFPRYNPIDPTFVKLQMVATLCNNSDFQLKDPMDPDAPPMDLPTELQKADFNLLNLGCTGDASETGLTKMVQLCRDVREFRALNPKLFEIKFNSTNKWQLSIHKQENGSPSPLLTLKGAPERVWTLCNRIEVNGTVQAITPEWEQKFETAYETLGAMGERVLGFAYRELDGYSLDYEFNDTPELNFPKDDLVFAGLFALIDPPRDGVPEAVEKCKKASVRVFMVTGDHPITAKAIALQIGILDQANLDSKRAAVVTGDDLRRIMEIESPEEQQAGWDQALSYDQLVFARVTPAHKLLIVENAQRLGMIVAVTGDGVNDAPALKQANVGISMGIAGKDVSKEAADLILMDDNFASIVKGVEEGRLIFDNLKKSIEYTLTSKFPELLPFLVFIAANMPLAITTILILCIDLGTDMLPAISLAYEEREKNIMTRPPRNPYKEHMVDARLLSFSYLHVGVLLFAAGFFTYFIVLNDYGYPPNILPGIGQGFSSFAPATLMCTYGSDGKPDACGYGCGQPSASNLASTCNGGCPIPFPGTYDPFLESTPMGFRGFAQGTEAVCGRTCSWYTALTPQTKAELLSYNSDPSNPSSLILTPEDVRLFDLYCTGANASTYGFAGRGEAESLSMAPTGAFYRWGAAPQLWPNKGYEATVLRKAQSAYFVAVVVCHATGLLISKTRKLSIFTINFLYNRFMLFALVFEFSVTVLLVYVPPLNIVFGTSDIKGEHWVPPIPWALLLLAYDEIRKLIMRKLPGGFVETYTYW